MKMLKANIFTATRDLCAFVNDSNIKKEDIQSIVFNNSAYTIFYWV